MFKSFLAVNSLVVELGSVNDKFDFILLVITFNFTSIFATSTSTFHGYFVVPRHSCFFIQTVTTFFCDVSKQKIRFDNLIYIAVPFFVYFLFLGGLPSRALSLLIIYGCVRFLLLYLFKLFFVLSLTRSFFSYFRVFQ